jgi:hypothetical protein
MDNPAAVAGGLAFLRCEGASPPATTRSRKSRVAHRRIKIERVYRPYLTAGMTTRRDGQRAWYCTVLYRICTHGGFETDIINTPCSNCMLLYEQPYIQTAALRK